MLPIKILVIQKRLHLKKNLFSSIYVLYNIHYVALHLVTVQKCLLMHTYR